MSVRATRAVNIACLDCNERLMLALRTCHGIEATDELLRKARPYLNTGRLYVDNGRIIASIEGINILNTIITDLMQE